MSYSQTQIAVLAEKNGYVFCGRDGADWHLMKYIDATNRVTAGRFESLKAIASFLKRSDEYGEYEELERED